MAYTPTPQSVISTVNSSTSVLAVATAFTGTAEDVTQYASATVLVIASHASATDGLSIQQSSDSTNWDNVDAYTIPAATGKSFGVQITGRYLRVVYTNGATLQTSFRLQTLYHYYAVPTSSTRPQDARTNDNDMQESIAYVAGYNGTTWDRLRTTGTGVLSTSAIVTDGTNSANVLKSDGTAAGQNAQIVAGSYLPVTFTTTTVQAVGATDAGNYKSVSVQVTNQGTSSAVAFQQSNDNTNWVVVPMVSTTVTSGAVSTSVATTGSWSATLSARYFRLNVTGISALTTAGVIVFSTNPWVPGTTMVNQGGTWTVGLSAAQTLATVTTVSAVTAITNALPAGTNLLGKVGIDQTTPGTTNAVVDTATTAGGLLIVTGSVGATATAIKASAGQLYGYHLFNTTAAVAYVQIFNVASGSVTLGTTPPTISIGLPASGGVTVNFDKGIAFGTAISFACTTTRTGLTGATCDVNFYYK